MCFSFLPVCMWLLNPQILFLNDILFTGNSIHVYNVFWSYSPLTTSFQLPRIHKLFPSWLGVLFKIIIINIVFVNPVSAMCTQVWGHPRQHRQPICGHTLEEKWLSSLNSHKLQKLSRGGTLGFSSPICAGFCLAWSCAYCVQTVTGAVTWCVQHPYDQKPA